MDSSCEDFEKARIMLHDIFENEDVSDDIWNCYDDMQENVGELLIIFDEYQNESEFQNLEFRIRLFTTLIHEFSIAHSAFLSHGIPEHCKDILAVIGKNLVAKRETFITAAECS